MNESQTVLLKLSITPDPSELRVAARQGIARYARAMAEEWGQLAERLEQESAREMAELHMREVDTSPVEGAIS